MKRSRTRCLWLWTVAAVIARPELSFAQATPTCVATPPNLISSWTADAVSGTTVFDRRGQNSATISGNVQVVPGLVGQAFAFDGTVGTRLSGTLMNGGFGSGNVPLTLMAWVNQTVTVTHPGDGVVGVGGPAHGQHFFGRLCGSCLNDGIWRLEGGLFPDGQNRLWVGADSGSLDRWWGSSTVIHPGSWHLVAYSYDPSTTSVRIYVDGAFDRAVTLTAPLSLTQSFYVGADGHSDNWFTGLIDEVQVYARALAQSEIQAIFNAGSAGLCASTDGVVSGQVTASSTTAGLPNMWVRFYDASGTYVRQGQTDAAGSYSVALAPGSYYARTWNAQGYINKLYNNMACAGCDPRNGAPIVVTNTGRTGISFALDVGGRIAGRVTNASTALPVTNGAVLINIHAPNGQIVAGASTDASGNYVSDAGLTAGTYFALTSNGAGLIDEVFNDIACVGCDPAAIGVPISVATGATTSGIDFALTPGGRLSGRVTNAATGTGLASSLTGFVSVNLFNTSGTFVTAGVTDASGSYITPAVPPGAYYAKTFNNLLYVDKLFDNITCPGCTITTGTALPLTAGAITSNVNFALNAGGRIGGTVTNAVAGAPLANVAVQIFNSAGSFVASSHTDASGNYFSHAVAAGSYYVRTLNSAGFTDEVFNDIPCGTSCNVTSGTPITVSLGATSGGVNFALASNGRISGSVTSSTTGAGIAQVSVYVYTNTSDSPVASALTDTSGNYTTTELAAGTYFARTSNNADFIDELFDNLLCTGGKCNVFSGTPIAVPAGTTTGSINFTLAPGGRISGRVTNEATGAALGGLTVNIFDSGGSQVTSGNSDASGNYVSRAGLPTGTYFARTSGVGSSGLVDETYSDIFCWFCDVTTGTPIAVTAGATTANINFALPTGGGVTGTITNAATGAAFSSGVVVQLYGSVGAFLGIYGIDPNGRYTINGLPPGNYFALTVNFQGFIDEVFDDAPCAGCDVTTGTPIAVTLGATTGNVNFALGIGGRISGTVTNEATGAPLPNVSVRIYDSNRTAVVFASTDGSGTYTSRGLPTGTYFATTFNTLGLIDEVFDNQQCLTCDPTTGTPIAVTAGTTTSNINFGLAAGGRISGRIISVASGSPLGSSNVEFFDASGTFVGDRLTDAQGNYTSRGLPAGNYFAKTSASLGFVDELYNDIVCPSCDVTAGHAIPVTVGATTPNIDFALAAGGRFSGVVTRADTGAPLRDVSVEVYNSSGVFMGSRRTRGGFYTSPGAYTSPGLPAGTYYAKTFNTLGYQDELFSEIPCSSCTATTGAPITVTVNTTTPSINFTLAPSGRISGRVTNEATGAGLGNVTVSIYSATGSRVAEVNTDSSGNYITSALKPDPYFARTFNSQGYIDELYHDIGCASSCNVTTGTVITVTAGSTPTIINFALVAAPPAFTGISGRVTNHGTGAGLGNVNVSIYNSTGVFVTGVNTDGSGNYTTASLASGTHFARTFNSQGFVDELYNDIACSSCNVTTGTPITVTAGTASTNINFALASGGKIAGRVTSEVTGSDLADVSVGIYSGSSSSPLATAVTDAAGNYSTPPLPPGTYFVRTSNFQGFIDELFENVPCLGCDVTTGTPIVVGAGATNNINFALAPGGGISGRITNEATGAGLAGVGVRIYNGAGVFIGSTNADASGNYAATALGLATGTYFAVTSNSSGFIDELFNNIPCGGCNITSGTPIPVTGGATTGSVNFALVIGGGISGRVTASATGAPLANVGVQIFNSNGIFVADATTDASGSYATKTGLPTDSYFARTSNSKGFLDEVFRNVRCLSCDVTAGAPISVTAGGTSSNVNFALQLGGRISGRVIDASNGRGLAGISVMIYVGRGFGSPPRFGGGDLAWSGITDSSGYYASPGLGPGPDGFEYYYFVRTFNSSGFIDSGTAGIKVAAGATTGDSDIALTPGGRIAGRITNAATGAPLANVYVDVQMTSQSVDRYFARVTTDSAGNYLAAVPAGTYTANTQTGGGFVDEWYDDIPCDSYCLNGFKATLITVAVGGTAGNINFALAVKATGSISGRVVNAITGGGIANVAVNIYDSAGSFVMGRNTDASGNYTMSGVVPGWYYARTFNSQGLLNQLYPGIRCMGCNVRRGRALWVAAGENTDRIDFALRIAPTLSVSATAVAPGSSVTVTIANARGDINDAVVLLRVGDGDNNWVYFGYLGYGSTSGARVVKMPETEGDYEFQLAEMDAGGTISLLERSPPVRVQPGNPVPNVTSLNPSVVAAGSAAFSLRVLGSGFVSGSVARWNGADRPTTFVGTSEVSAAITPADVATGGTAAVTVFNPTPGGGTSNSVTFTITPLAPVPVISSISPTSVSINSGAFTLTVNGSGFAAGSVVRLNGGDRTTSFVSSPQLTAVIPAGDITSLGARTITVFTPAPGGGTSNAVTFTVIAPAPTLTVNVTSVNPGSPATVTLVNGPGGATDWLAVAQTTAPNTTYLNFTYVGAGVTTRTWTVNMPATVGAYEFRLFANNGYTRLATSPAVRVEVTNPVPAIANVNPAGIAAGSAGFSLRVLGSSFVSSSVVRWNGTDRPTTFVGPGEIRATIATADVATAATAAVTVFNPTPGGGTSNSVTFTISAPPPVPAITTITPASVAVNGPAFQLTVAGTGFAPSSVVRLNGADRLTEYVSATQLKAGVEAGDLASAGAKAITVVTPAPGGGTSNAETLTVTGPTLTVNTTSVNPGGSATVTLTNGLGGSTDWLGVALTSAPNNSYLNFTYVGAGLTTRTWTVNMPTTVGDYEFRLFANNGYTRLATSPTVRVEVTNPVPAITSLNPTGVAAGTSSLSLRVLGSNFVSSSVVRWNGTDRPTTQVGPGEVRATISATDLASEGTAAVTVFSPAPGGGTSNSATFTIIPPPPVPALASISPSSIAMGTHGTSLKLIGSGFAPTSVMRINGADRITTYVSGTELTTSLPGSDLASAGARAITVFTPSPGGGTSNAVTLTVTGPTLTVNATSVNPGAPATVTLANGLGGATDWLGVARTDAPNTSYLIFTYVGAGVANRTWTVNMPAAVGDYEFRLFANNGYTRLATSPIVKVEVTNPVPAIASLSPTGIAAGSPGATLRVLGSNFVSSSVVRWNGTDRPTTFVGPGEVRASLGTADLASEGTASVTVLNPAPGGGTSNSATFTLTPPPPVPAITTISPTSVTMNSAAFTLTLDGSGFAPNSVVRLNGTDRLTTFVSVSQLTAAVQAGDLTSSGAKTITVFTPAPGGGTSNAVTLIVVGPTLTVNTTSVNPGAPATVTLANGLGGATDWLGVARTDAPNTSYVIFTYVGAGVANRTWTVNMPTPVGDYEFRLFANNGYTRLATSPTVRVEVTNPVPAITSLNPTGIAAGSASLSLRVLGSNFVSSSVVRWNGTDRPTTFVGPGEVRAAIGTADLASEGTAAITVFNPTPGGGTSNSATFALTPPPPVPAITTISPTSVQLNSAAFTLTVNGTGFAPNTAVRLNGTDRLTTFVSVSQLTAGVQAADLTSSGAKTITVFTPAPGGGMSNAVTLTVLGPTLTVNTTSVNPGALATVTLANGLGGATDWLGVARTDTPNTSYVIFTYVGAGVANRTWTVNMPTTVGDYEFRLFANNGYTRLATSPTVRVEVTNPLPAITSLNPTGIAAGSASVSLRVLGSNFVSSSVVRWNGMDRPTTFVGPGEVRASLGTADLASEGTASVTVFNPTPGGGTSNSATFALTPPPPVPVISTIAPPSVQMNSAAFTLTVTGSGFAPNSVVRLNGSDRFTTYTSATQLTAAIQAGDLTSAGTRAMTVITPAPGGGTSNTVTLTVTGPTLSVNTTSVNPGAPATVTLVNGLGGATDWLGVARTDAPNTSYLMFTYVGAGVATRTWTANMPTTVGNYEFRLFADNGFTRLATSPMVRVEVTNPMPAITSVNPSGVAAGTSSLSLRVLGSNFVSSSVVRWNGTERSTTFVGPTEVRAAITAADLASEGSAAVTVFSPTPGGGTSNSATFAITAPPPVPAITSISPTSVPLNSAAFTLTVNGTGFAPNSVVRLNGTDRLTTFVSSSQVTAGIQAGDLTSAGAKTITVFTPAPGGGLSNAATLTVVGPTLTVNATSVNPGAPATVTLTNGLGGATDWLAVARTDAANTSYILFTYVGAGVTTRTWTVNMPSTVGTYEFRLFANNGFTRLATSPVVRVEVTNPVPTLTSLNPSGIAAGSPAFTLRVLGTNFVLSSVVRFSESDRPTTFVSGTEVRATIPDTAVATEGSGIITVFNPGPGGGTSGHLSFSVTPAPGIPAITNITPSSVTMAGPAFTLTVDGTNFAPNSVVRVNGADRVTAFTSNTRLTANVLAGDITTAGARTIAVFTPAPGGGISNGVTLNVLAPTLTVNASAVAPGAQVTMTLANGLGGSTDWLALARVADANTSYLTFVYVGAGITTRTWTVTMPTALGSYEFRLYANNGFTRLATSPTVTVGTTQGVGWDARDPIPRERPYAVGAVLGGKMHVIGGESQLWRNWVDVNDPASNTWTAGPSTPTGLVAHTAVALDGRLHIVGGCGDQGGCDPGAAPARAHWIFNAAAGTWAAAAGLATHRIYAAGAAFGGKLYIIGGNRPALRTLLGSVEVHDPGTN